MLTNRLEGAANHLHCTLGLICSLRPPRSALFPNFTEIEGTQLAVAALLPARPPNLVLRYRQAGPLPCAGAHVRGEALVLLALRGEALLQQALGLARADQARLDLPPSGALLGRCSTA